MTFKNTACLATLFLSFPLLVPAVCSAGYDDHILDATDAGNQEVFNASEKAEYSTVIMGRAINEDDGTRTELKASNNRATFGSGVTVRSKAVGGEAVYQISGDGTGITVEAGSNTIIFAAGSRFESADGASDARYIYGGIVSIGDDKTVAVNGTFTASENEVDIQSGAVFGAAGKITIIGGSSANDGNGSGEVKSQKNKVTINGSDFAGTAEAPLEFAQISAGVAFAKNGKAAAGSAEEYNYAESCQEWGNTR